MMKIYDLVFSRIYKFSSSIFSKNRGAFENSTILILSLLLTINFITVQKFINVQSFQVNIFTYLFFIVNVIFNYVRFVRDERYLIIIERHRGILRSRLIDIFVWSYVILTFILFLSW